MGLTAATCINNNSSSVFSHCLHVRLLITVTCLLCIDIIEFKLIYYLCFYHCYCSLHYPRQIVNISCADDPYRWSWNHFSYVLYYYYVNISRYLSLASRSNYITKTLGPAHNNWDRRSDRCHYQIFPL